jgi:hypothetical protein
MALTTAERVDIRRFCGFPAYAHFGWVFEAEYATLELRMDNFADEELAVIRINHLPDLYTLESAIVTASSNLDTDAASVWTHNKNEVADRFGLYNRKRRELCAFIGVRPGRGLGSSSSVVRC